MRLEIPSPATALPRACARSSAGYEHLEQIG
jgi:hypothetical protein